MTDSYSDEDKRKNQDIYEYLQINWHSPLIYQKKKKKKSKQFVNDTLKKKNKEHKDHFANNGDRLAVLRCN